MDKKEALKKAKIFADELQGIFGQLPMERVVANHIGFFNALRSAGITWPQIAKLMKSTEVRRKDGSPVPPEQWRAMISRVGAMRPSDQADAPPTVTTKKPTARQQSKPVHSPKQRPHRVNAGENDIRQKMRQATSARKSTGETNG